MFSFMFSVLGSALFWAIFFIVGVVIGSTLIRCFAKNTWHYFKTGECRVKAGYSILESEPTEMILIAILFIFFWPVILAGMIIKVCFKSLLWPSFKACVVNAGSVIPDIEIKTNKEA